MRHKSHRYYNKNFPRRETPKRTQPRPNPYRLYPNEEPNRTVPDKKPNPEPRYPFWLTQGSHEFIWIDEMIVYYSPN
jgi:anaerobic selenocysteine-containing dehydrogenase